MSGARLFPDFAAVPTARERAAARWANTSAQLSLSIDDVALADDRCPVCSGEHAEHDCPHGTAPTLDLAGCTCSDCGQVAAIHPDSHDQRGEPVCFVCAAQGAFAP